MRYFYIIISVLLVMACQTTVEEVQEQKESMATKAGSAPTNEVAKKKVIAPFISKKGGFRVQFPEEPVAKQQVVNSEIGQVQLHQFIYEKEKTQAWLVSYSDYPAQMIQLGNPKSLIRGIRNHVLSGLGARAKNEKELELGAYKGISFSAYSAARKMEVLYRVYLVNNRVYQLGMFSSIGQFSSQDSSAFMDSFVLLSQDTIPQ